MIATSLGGIGMFLLGMILMTGGLKALAGQSLRAGLAKATGNRFLSFATGAGLTALIQSSAAVTLTTIGFVSAGIMTFQQSVGVILGANVGTTFTGWIVSLLGLKLSIGAAAMPLIAVGAMIRLVSRDRIAAVGEAIAGFGLLFVGIDLLATGMAGLVNRIDPSVFPEPTWLGRWVLVGIGFVMALVMQSSSAAMATTLAALHAGNLNFDQAAALIIGQNVGTTVSAGVASLGGSTAARRTAASHILFNLTTCLAATLLLTPFIAIVKAGSPALEPAPGPVTLAAFHTVFNLGGALLFLPFIKPFARLIERLLPEHEPDLIRRLDVTLLRDPATAVEAARRTAIDVASVVIEALRDYVTHGAAGTMRPRLEAADRALAETRLYLAKVRTPEAARAAYQRHLSTLHAVDHLDRLIEAAGEPRSARTAARDPALRDMARGMLDEFDATLAWLKDVEKPAPAGVLEAMSKSLAEQRKQHRPRILEDTAHGRLTPDEATDQLEAARWVDRLGYHIWRAVLHLGETPVPVAPTGVHTDPANGGNG